MRERRTTSNPDDGLTRVELYVRSLSPAGARSRQDAVIERLAALTEHDTIGEYAVHVWGTGIRPDSPTARTPSGAFASERLGAFEDWAARNGVTLGGAFHMREVNSTLTGKSYTERSFPVLTLAAFSRASGARSFERAGRSVAPTAFSGPKLRCVAPYREGSNTYSVEDCLDAIEGGRAFVGRETPKPLPAGRDRRTAANPSADRSTEEGSNPFAVPGSIGE